jgi:polar amino acid transport system substrate-binding protein
LTAAPGAARQEAVALSGSRRPWGRLLACSALLAAAAARAADDRPLRWAADEEGGAPYVFKDRDLNRVGFEVDLAEALSRELGRPIEFTQYNFENLVPGLLKGDFDFAMNGLEVTPERKEQVRFSKPYYLYRQQLVVRGDEERFATMRGCRATPGVTVGTMEATAAERLLDGWGVRKESYPSPLEAYQDLALGRADAVLLDWPMAEYYARPDRRLKFAGRPFARGYYAIAFRPDDGELADRVDAALKRLIESGELQRILSKWRLWDEAQLELLSLYGLIPERWVPPEEEEPEQGLVAGLGSDWSPARYLLLLLQGALVTIELSVLSFALAVAVGLVVAVTRMYGPRWLRPFAVGYVEFFRGVPVLLLLFFLYFGLPTFSEYYGWGSALAVSPFVAAVLGLGLNYAAYEAEVYRAGIGAVPAGQWEAAAALGMPRGLTFRRIILPQALRTILPPMTSDFVALFKDTSIASAIALVELNKEYQILSKSSLKFLEIGLITALLYLVMSVPLGWLSRRLERRWTKAAA